MYICTSLGPNQPKLCWQWIVTLINLPFCERRSLLWFGLVPFLRMTHSHWLCCMRASASGSGSDLSFLPPKSEDYILRPSVCHFTIYHSPPPHVRHLRHTFTHLASHSFTYSLTHFEKPSAWIALRFVKGTKDSSGWNMQYRDCLQDSTPFKLNDDGNDSLSSTRGKGSTRS